MKSISDAIIPAKKEKSLNDTTHSVDLISSEKAKQLYDEAKSRLLDVNHWDKWCSRISAKFMLTDENGRPVNRKAQNGDYFKIDVASRGHASGKGSDWVKIEALEEETPADEDSNTFNMKVRSAGNPLNDSKNASCFFDVDATSSFVITRAGRKVIAAVVSWNEKPKVKTGVISDNVRSAFMSIDAFAGFSKTQWKNLVIEIIAYKGL